MSFKPGRLNIKLDISPKIPDKFFNEINKTVQKMAQIASEQLNLSIKNLAETGKKLDEKIEEFSDCGWPMPMYLGFGELLEIYESSTHYTIDQKMVSVFDEGTPDFSEMKKALSSSKELEDWSLLIEECFYCYNKKKYQVTIPSLISVLEGVLAKKFNQLDRKSINVQNEINKKLASDGNTFEALYLKSIGTFLVHLFATITPKERDHPKLKRNLISHGRSTRIWGKAESLKLFLNIYVLAGFMGTD